MNNKQKAATAFVIAGAGLAIIGLSRAEAAPPPPPPGKANVYGKARDSVTGAAVSGVTVLVGGYQTTTDGSGNYLIEGIDPGSYSTVFEKSGYLQEEIMITLLEGNNVLDVQMVRIVSEATLFGTVTDTAGVPLSGVKVTVGGVVVYTNGAGEYILFVAPGTYAVTFEKSGYQTLTR